MLINKNQFVKTINADNAEEFDEKLNRKLKELGKKGITYELRLAPELGFTAFIMYRETIMIPENTADEFELGGETHRCEECPFWVRPTDGRVKYTRCEITPGIHGKDSYCCNEFYEKLLRGEIELREVPDWKKLADWKK